jgi:ankyrin repeat protein
LELSNPTPLQLATVNNKKDVVEFLLGWDADPNAFGDVFLLQTE